MKSLTRRLLVSLVLSTVTLFTAPSIYANCTFSLVDSDGNYLGHCGCGSSAGNYCFDENLNDITDGLDGLVDAMCVAMCGGGRYEDSKNITTPSTPLMFKYPRSYEVARANLDELRRLRQTGSDSPFATTTLYEFVLR
jgi:hypothetical protein